MGEILTTLAMLGSMSGYAFAQADMAAPEESCAEFIEMTPDEQAIAIADANEAAEGQPAGGDPALSERAPEAVVAACTANTESTLGEAIEAATAN